MTDPFNTSEVRTAQLRPQIDRILSCTCRPKVNLIAHSQGGIDARPGIYTPLRVGNEIDLGTTRTTENPVDLWTKLSGAYLGRIERVGHSDVGAIPILTK